MGLGQENLLKKIKKLQDTANSYSGMGLEEAARLYASKVQELLIQHKLSMSDVDNAILDTEDPIDYESGVNEEMKEGRRLWWAEKFGSIIARAHFCKIFLNTSEGKIYFVGRKSDREIAIYMFVYLSRVMVDSMHEEKKHLKQLEKDAFKAWKTGKPVDVSHEPFDNKGFKDNFYVGFIQAIRDRYAEQEVKHEGSTALVKANADVVSWMGSNLVLSPGSRTKKKLRENNMARSLGNSYGQNANLSTKGVKSDCKQQNLIG